MHTTTQREPSTGTLEIDSQEPAQSYCLEIGEVHQTRAIPVRDGVTLTIGSHGRNDVVVRERTVSGTHCFVRCEKGCLWVEDRGSRNGIYIGGGRVPVARLAPGACFVMGRVTVAVRAWSQDEEPTPEAEPLPRVVGMSSAMIRVAAQTRRLARLSIPVLVRGPTGTGKDLVARALHELSPRSMRAFVALNAGGLTKELAEAELFGHERGAFTGAYTQKPGAFVAADGGTLFLDEIGDLSPEIQVKLLRTLEDGEVRPVGGTRSVRADVRVIAATCAPLERMVVDGRFREDLYHRLAVGMVTMPPLSERRSDISALTEHFLRLCERDVGQKMISPAALASLTAQKWPGNVRQLRNVVVRAAVMTASERVGATDIEAALREQPGSAVRLTPSSAKAVVDMHGGRVATAARSYGVPRSTFRGWLKGT